MKIKILNNLKTFTMFSVMLGFGSVISIFSTIGVDLLVLGSVILLMYVNRSCKMNLCLFKVTIGVCLAVVLNMVVTGTSFMEYLSVFGRVIAMALLITAFRNDYEDIKLHLIRAIKIITYLAAINIVLAIAVPDLFILAKASSGFPINTIGGIFNYWSVFDLKGVVLFRNQGMFWEPGVLQISVNILIYYILIEKKQPIKNILIPIIVLFSTVSTTGFVIFGIILLFKFYYTFKNYKHSFFRVILLVVVLVAFIPFLISELNNKLYGTDKVSAVSRTYDLLMALQVVRDYPFCGVGMSVDKYQILMSERTVIFDNNNVDTERGNTNTILQIFVNFGIPMALMLMYALFNQRLFDQRLLFFIIIFLSFCSEPLIGVFLMVLLMLASIKLIPSFD